MLPEQFMSLILDARAAGMTVQVEPALPRDYQSHAFGHEQAPPAHEARPSSMRDLGVSGNQAARWLREMNGESEDLSGSLLYNPAPSPSQASTNTTHNIHTKRNAEKCAKKKAKKHLSRLRAEEELNAASASNAHAEAQPPLPELIPSLSNESTPCPSMKSPQPVYERFLQRDASDVGKRSEPEQTQWPVIETTASPPLDSWEEEDEVRVNGLDASAIAQSPLLDSSPSPSDELAASPSPILFEDTNGAQDDSGASVLVQPDLLEISRSTIGEEEQEEEQVFTTVSRQRTHEPEARPPLWVRRHVGTYRNTQAEFQSAFAESPVSRKDRRRFNKMFQWHLDTQQRKAKTNRIVPAARIAQRASWTRESKEKLMDTLWQTIYHSERAASWYELLHPNDSGIPEQEGHAHFLNVLRDAFEILNNGVKFDQRSPPTRVT